jgi:hypothetical protein
MRAAKKIAVAVFALAALLVPAAWASAAAAPAWQLSLIPLPTNMQPGTSGKAFEAPLFRLLATNVGAKETSGPVTFTVTFPAGIAPVEDPEGPEEEPTGDDGDQKSPDPVCSAAGQEVTCTTPGPVYPSRWLGAKIPVEVSPGASGTRNIQATISGGSAQPVSTVSPTEINAEAPAFGFLPGSAGLASLLTDEDGTASTQAGSHPNQLTINLGFPTEHAEEGPTRSAGHVRDVITNLPQGLIVNPNATPARCTELQLLSSNEKAESKCPKDSELGIVTAMTELSGPTFVISHLYNMVPPPGAAAEVAFNALEVGIFVHLAGHVRSESDYGITAVSEDIVARTNNPILDVQAQLWGDPSSDSHSEIRGECLQVQNVTCSVPLQSKPLLSMPSACSQSLTFTARASSWEQPGVFDEREVLATDTTGNPVGVNECSLLEFEPKLSVQPDTSQAEAPTGVHVDLEVPQNEDKEELSTSNLKDTTVTFPEGLALNPAAASGLGACTPDQIGLLTGVGVSPVHFTEARPQCPESSKIGTVEVNTPLLDHPVLGSVYVAQPYQNPFGTLLGVYVVVDDPADGIVAKLAGRTEVINQQTGQLQTTFAENPELPFEDFKVDLFGGPRAALRTPATCGTFTTTSIETPWSGGPPVPTSDSFTVNQGANGGPCVTSEAQMPNSPGFEAGTATPIAGSYSPFLGRLQRADGTQLLKGLNLNLPPGLSGKLAGIPPCPAAAIDAAGAKTGTQELASPSCSAASQIGEVLVGAGAGPQPYYTTGKVYLAGPYNGGPASAAIITPAVAGPFDLGTVVTRAALYLNPVTAQITVKSDPIPRQLQGIQLEVRDVRINMARPDFTLNPTNCDPMGISGEAISVLDRVAPLFQRFQVGGCKGLDYEPKLVLRLHGGTRRGAHPKLRAVLTAKPGEANTARASVALPRSEFLENAHIQTVCTRVQFAAESCPAKSIYGHARAITPLLDEALEGPVYLRSSSHKLPDMVAALKGPPSRPIKIELDGRIDSVNGGIRSTFDLVPDQPVSKFVLSMQGGKKGLLVNSLNLCASTNRAQAKFNGQNGKVHDFSPVVQNDCKGKGASKRRHRLR